MAECGCQVKWNGGDLLVLRCPLHASAPALVDALERIESACLYANCSHTTHGECLRTLRAAVKLHNERIATALAAARGEQRVPDEPRPREAELGDPLCETCGKPATECSHDDVPLCRTCALDLICEAEERRADS